MKKNHLMLLAVAFSFNSFSQDTWIMSGTNVTTTTNGNVSLSGNLRNYNAGQMLWLSSNPYTGGPLPSFPYMIHTENINNSLIPNGSSLTVDNTLTGTQIGQQTLLQFRGTSGDKTGAALSLTSLTNGVMTGSSIGLSSSSASIMYGQKISVSSSSVATATKYGLYADVGTGAGTRYGIYANISLGSGDRYGVYSKVSTSGTGIKYGVYSEAIGTGARAGYFKGDLETNGSVIMTGNNQSRFSFIASTASSSPISGQTLTIAPNVTTGLDDWNNNQSLVFYNNGLLRKNTNGTATTDVFSIYNTASSREVFKVKATGTVYATEINVQSSIFPDYVFKPEYDLMPLSKVKTFIAEQGHLPNIPTEKEVLSEGLNVGDMTIKLVEKVEELTLYLLKQQEEIEMLKAEIKASKH